MIEDEHDELPETDADETGMAADLEVEELTQNGNMEQLAELVLNGEGRRLVGRQSSNPELQAFIDDVPAYMVLLISLFFNFNISFHRIFDICLSGQNPRCTHGSSRR